MQQMQNFYWLNFGGRRPQIKLSSLTRNPGDVMVTGRVCKSLNFPIDFIHIQTLQFMWNTRTKYDIFPFKEQVEVIIDDSRMMRIKQEVQEEKDEDEDANSDGFTGEGWMPVGEEEDEEEMEDGLCERLTAGGWVSDNEVIQVEIKQEAEDDGSLQAQTLGGENILSVREIDSQEVQEDNDDEFADFPSKFYIKQEPSDDDEKDIVPSGVEGMINQARDSSTLTTNFVAPEQPSTSKGDIAYGEEDSIDGGKSINRGDESCLTVHSGGKLHQCCCCRCKMKLCQDDANSLTYVRSCMQRNECCYCKQEYSCKCDHRVHHTHPDYIHIPEGCSDKLNQTDHLQTDEKLLMVKRTP
ncbi:uncharacterized protein LOC129254817 isoform X5 [Lytechinus pictus]|uniref:uncharacterized protein LOC129254817 isoform X5 n=1 Tax=Lytechinus pictus TaxID=7653 RepID=UPI0030B9F061